IPVMRMAVSRLIDFMFRPLNRDLAHRQPCQIASWHGCRRAKWLKLPAAIREYRVRKATSNQRNSLETSKFVPYTNNRNGKLETGTDHACECAGHMTFQKIWRFK